MLRYFKYVVRYLHFILLAAVFIIGEVLMDLLQPEIMGKIVDDGVLGLNNGGVGNLSLIWSLGLRMVTLVLIGGISGALSNAFFHLGGQNLGNDIRKDCFRKIMTFSFPQMDHFGTGSIVTRMTNDITQVQNLVSVCFRGSVRTFMLTFGSLYFMFRLDHRFGLIVLCVLPFLLGCMALCLSRANPLFYKLQAQLDAINSIMQEDVSGIRVIKACVRELYEKRRFGKANDELIKTQLQVLVILAFMNPVINALMYLTVAAILLFGSFDVSAGSTTPGSIMAAITYSTQLLNGVLMLAMLFQSISRGIASWTRTREILDSEPDLRDGPFLGDTPIHGEIEFRDVSFAYPGSDKQILSHINLKVRQGETVAIMGATGCGKTSLLQLIPRFYDVTSGAVLVDGVDVRDYNQKALREKVSIALQKSELFSTSIQENIQWGAPAADESRVRAAAVIAQADGFIRSKEEAYQTPVAERGMSLSGGQKQRLSIARAVIKDAEILLLDDSTSALDLKTEADLYQALRQSCPKTTKILIAQRIASARHADRIVVLNNGTVASAGTHEELLASCGIYQDIYYSQLEEEANGHG